MPGADIFAMFDSDDIADPATGDDFVKSLEKRRVSEDMGDVESTASAPRGRDQVMAILQAGGHGLLAEDVVTVLKGIDGLAMVVAIR